MNGLDDLREQSSLHNILNEIPQRVRRGLSIVEVQFTCFDVVEEFITIGTNIGVVYWCNRKTNKIERLRPHICGPAISHVKVVSSVDYMVAAGDDTGVVSIFVIPKEKIIPVIPDHGYVSEGIERFTASDLHLSTVSAIAWSANGQKLFTGDEKGIVVLTQMDFRLNIIRSTEILNENYPIVQLDYRSQVLLVASENRCILYHQNVNNSCPKICQVGQKERERLSKLGALIGSHSSPARPVIFSARPKQRIWLADTEGTVNKTLLFKEPLSKTYREIPISRPSSVPDLTSQISSDSNSITSSVGSSSNTCNSCCNIEFNYLHKYEDKYLIAHDAHSLVILNVETTSVIAGFTSRKIISVSVNKDEFFTLENHRQIRRISSRIDPYSSTQSCDTHKEMPLGDKLLGIVSKITSETSTSVMEPLFENLKKMENVIINSQIMTGSETISPAEEALDFCFTGHSSHDHTQKSPTSHDVNSSSHYIDPQGLGQEEGTILSCSVKGKFNENVSSKGLARTVDTHANRPATKALEESCSRLASFKEVPKDIIPDMRELDSILHDVEQKELIISQLLNGNKLPSKNLHTKEKNQSIFSNSKSDESLLSEQNSVEVLNSEIKSCEEAFEPGTSIQLEDPSSTNEQPEDVLLEIKEESVLNASCDISLPECKGELDSTHIALIQCYCERYWRKWKLPFMVKWVCVSQKDVFCGGPKQSVYRSSRKQPQIKWSKQKFRTSRMAVSQSGSILWKLDLSLLYAFKNTCKSIHDTGSWELIARNVDSVAVNDWSAWYTKSGSIFVQTGLSAETPFNESVKLECVHNLSKVCCFDNNVWVLTSDGTIYNRESITKENPFGSTWEKKEHPNTITISDIALCARNTGWIIDKLNNIYFTNTMAGTKTEWWQVIIGRHIHKSDSTLSDQLSRFVHWSKEKHTVYTIGSDADSIWVSVSNENTICINRTAILGHSWLPISMNSSSMSKTKWRFLAVAGENGRNTSVWCLSCSNDLFLYLADQNNMRAVDMATTDDVVCMSSVPDMLWILTDRGQIFVRRGISDETPFGWTWEELFSYQNEYSISSLKHISIGRDVIWALSSDDKVYAAIADLYLITYDTCSLNWVLIEDTLLAESKFIDVVVGPNKYMVWALDDKYNVYTRSSIFDDYPFGTEWVKVPGIKAIHLSISWSAVWALTAEGYIYRRSDITPEDCAGDHWTQIPGCLSLITASVDEDVWGVSKMTGRLLRYKNCVLSLKEDFIKERKFLENIEDGWEVLDYLSFDGDS